LLVVNGRIGWVLLAMSLTAACAGSPGVDVEDATRVEPVGPATTTVSPPATPSTQAAPALNELAGVGDSLFPALGNGGYDVEHYSLAMEVDVAENLLDATATIEATATDALEVFHLDLQGLEILEVTVDGAEAMVERSGHEVVITPEQAIADTATFTVVMRYLGTPEPINDPVTPADLGGWRQTEDTVFVVSQPSGAMSWFPNNNHPSDKATFDFAITTDSDLTVVANGVLDGIEEADSGQSTTTWRMEDPMTTYLAAVYIGEFELRESVTDDGLRIRNYFPPAFADDLEEDFDLTADVIDFSEDLFGAAYPFDEYGSIVLPFSVGFALENQTISVHGLSATAPDIIAHEIMHQWAGNSVTLGDWQDIWMNEGFATYLASLYFEDRGLSSDIEPVGMYAALSGGSIGPAEVPVDELFGTSVYFRGAMALHALRVEVGDDVFREILVTYYDRFAGADITTVEFLDVVDEVAGPDAVAVLDDWLYGDELPDFPE
jgi:aminopeptidase N